LVTGHLSFVTPSPRPPGRRHPVTLSPCHLRLYFTSMSTRRVIHVESDQTLIPAARWCNSYMTKLRGFTFHRPPKLDEGLVLVENSDSRVNASITMLFTFAALAVIWVNDAGEVVGSVLARPWRPSYIPPAPARYAVEGHPALLEKVKVGDHIRFVEGKR
jgi:uncharacterized membrane protein (UPF0127 family)